MDRDDLVGAGSEGLARACASFDEAIGVPFEAYAVRRIRGAILDELRTNDFVTRHGRRQQRDVELAAHALEREQRRVPDESEIAARIGLPVSEVARIRSDVARAAAMTDGAPIDIDGVTSNADDAEARCVMAELRDQLARAIRGMPLRTQEVLALYYQEELTQADIGRALGVTESRVCQMLRAATSQLRAALDAGDSAGSSGRAGVEPPRRDGKAPPATHAQVRVVSAHSACG